VKRHIITLVVAIFLTGCDNPKRQPETVDQALRQQIFMECLRTVPQGPKTTASNDWAEVVEQCADAALDMATTATYSNRIYKRDN